MLPESMPNPERQSVLQELRRTDAKCGEPFCGLLLTNPAPSRVRAFRHAGVVGFTLLPGAMPYVTSRQFQLVITYLADGQEAPTA